LIVIYVFNFKVLPLERAPIETVHLQNILAFLNVGLAAFVLTAVAGRFAYPAVSLEGEAFWIVLAGPIGLKAFLWIKFFIYLVPLLFLAETLIVATNLLLEVSGLMMGLSVATIAFMVPAVTALAVGLGAAYPDFNAENAAQAVTSFGGLVFMLLAASYITFIIILEAGPVYHFMKASLFNRQLPVAIHFWGAGAVALSAVISILTVVGAMEHGVRRLSRQGRKTAEGGGQS
jgi:ABC-2 type transport system permease protein